jgi:pimeloyl-ACP methyl ester carboxylesterase
MLYEAMDNAKQTIEINGQKLVYYRFGQGKPLLFLHGARIQALTFKNSLEQLATHYLVIAPDIPGHGGSETPKGDWSFTDYATFFSDFLKMLDLQDAIVVGYSMGGGIAFNLAAISGSITRLVLIDASGLNTTNKQRSQQDFRRLLFYFSHPRYVGILSLLLRNYLGFLWLHRGDSGHMQRIQRARSETQYDDALANIKVPTLLLWGKNDWVIPLSVAYEFKKRIPQADLKIVDGNHDWPLYMPLLLSQLMI